ncbi:MULTISPECIES: DUF2510 domain-containing protein [Streptomyces]|uniref:DUF2510 domain-containing protein n=3 Tax=Streptomyces TaxID=1883 RepID=A0ABQ7FQW8_9ACTN|nr:MULTISPECIES: DUF2510 domain-containing protein [Streptomyces]KAF4409747.1 DUF2510 domain-containing protein [Streptomyces lycii]PGH51236.1 hypothetical protein CRI70_07655 [Streptomyces sp. Ru87]
MTTPPGWYPDPGHNGGAPQPERWWNGSAWTEHTREARIADGPERLRSGGFFEPPPEPPAGAGGYGRPESLRGAHRRAETVVALTVLVLILAAVGGIVWLGAETERRNTAAPWPAPTAPAEPGPEDRPGGGGGFGDESGPQNEDGGRGGEEGGGEPVPPGPADRAMDAVNGIYLPVPEGWEGRSGSAGAGLTTGPYACPGDDELRCVRGGVNSLAADGYDATTAKGIAEEDIALNAEESYGKSPTTGDEAYGGIEDEQEVASEPVTVAGERGHLVRWKLDTADGAGGYVQSLVFPSPLDEDRFVVVRFGFDASDEAPPLSVMDEITEGIEPLTGGAVPDGRAV